MSSTSQKLLVPIGFTNQSIIALQQAVAMASKNQYKVIILNVLDLPSTFNMLFSNFEEKKQDLQEKANHKLQELKEQYCQGIDVECLVTKGKVYEKVVEVATMLKVDLIVMGTDGTDNNIKKNLLAPTPTRLSDRPSYLLLL